MILRDGKKFLKAADVTTGDKILIKDEGAWVENTKYKYPDGSPKVDFIISVTFKEEDLDFRVNKTNRTTLMGLFGKDTTLWVGKTVELEKIKTLIGGKQMDVLMIGGLEELQESPEGVDQEPPF